MKNKLPSVIGHRGAAGHAPENTFAGFEEAAALGVRWVEFDVRLTHDKQIIVFHDEVLERSTNAKGFVSERDWKDIRHCDAGSWYGPAYCDEAIPTLLDVISRLEELELGANVEIKSSAGREHESGQLVASLLKKHWPSSLPPVLISSFNPACLVAAMAVAPEIERALVVNVIPPDWEARLKVLGCHALHCRHEKLTQSLVQQIISKGFSLRCFTVNDDKTAEVLFQWGAESVFTDYPDRILGSSNLGLNSQPK